MNLSDYTESQTQYFDLLRPLLASSDISSKLLAEATRELLIVQSDLVAASFAKTLTSLVPAFAPGDPSYALWQLPADYQAQSERWLNALMETMGIISRVQQQLLDVQGQSLAQGVQGATKAMAQVTGVLASRRVTAEVINLSDRRATPSPAAQSSAPYTKASVGDVERASSTRTKNQAAG